MRKIVALILPLLFLSIMTIQVSGVIVGSWNGALVVLNEPNYPYQLVCIGDAKSGLVVGVALKENGFTLGGGEPTLSEGLMAWLPTVATTFKLNPVEADTIVLIGDEIPTAVWWGNENEIFNALMAQNWGFLNSRLVAQGVARGQWTEKSDLIALNRICGELNHIDGSTAVLTVLWIGQWDEMGALTKEIVMVKLL